MLRRPDLRPFLVVVIVVVVVVVVVVFESMLDDYDNDGPWSQTVSETMRRRTDRIHSG
jgi:Na+/glutamate symporter